MNKAANIDDDLSGVSLNDISRTKKMSAGSELFINRKHQTGYYDENTASLFLAGDNPPALPQSDDAVGRRIYPVEFPYSFKENPIPDNPLERQKRPKQKVLDEIKSDERLQGLLVLGIEGLVRLLREGEFTTNKSREERMQAYEDHSDPIGSFGSIANVRGSQPAVSAREKRSAGRLDIAVPGLQ